MDAMSLIASGLGEMKQGFQSQAQSGLNLALATAQEMYNRKLTNRILEREDNAVQRRVADMKNAGISPIYAFGAGAGAGGTVSSQRSAPQISGEVANNSLRAFEIMYQKEVQSAQIDNLKAQNDNIVEQNNLLKAQVDEARERAKGQKISNSVEQYEFDLAKGRGTSTRMNGNPVVGGVDALTNVLMPGAGAGSSAGKRMKRLNFLTTPNGEAYIFFNRQKRLRALQELGLSDKDFLWKPKVYIKYKKQVLDKMLSY